VVGRAGASRPPIPDRDAYLADWSRGHGGADPSATRLVRLWLSLTYTIARPAARAGMRPDLLTLAGVLVAALAVVPAAAGARWPLVAAALVGLSGLLDNLDGAVAVLTGRATRWGAVLDALADRLADATYLVALWLAGAGGWVCVVGGGLMALHEYARARAGALGMTEVGVVTVWERPTRVIVTAAFLTAAGVLPDGRWAGLGAAAWVGLGFVGLAQLLPVVHRRLQ
jgi:phosphatidylglycerophosphate synthase